MTTPTFDPANPVTPSWAKRRCDALRKGLEPEPIPGPLEPWEDHAGAECFRETLALDADSPSFSFCNTHNIGLVKKGRSTMTAPVLPAAVLVARAALDALSDEERELLFATYGVFQ